MGMGGGGGGVYRKMDRGGGGGGVAITDHDWIRAWLAYQFAIKNGKIVKEWGKTEVAGKE